jgi:hypothetical protein
MVLCNSNPQPLSAKILAMDFVLYAIHLSTLIDAINVNKEGIRYAPIWQAGIYGWTILVRFV